MFLTYESSIKLNPIVDSKNMNILQRFKTDVYDWKKKCKASNKYLTKLVWTG